jgi:hypothetical protein
MRGPFIQSYTDHTGIAVNFRWYEHRRLANFTSLGSSFSHFRFHSRSANAVSITMQNHSFAFALLWLMLLFSRKFDPGGKFGLVSGSYDGSWRNGAVDWRLLDAFGARTRTRRRVSGTERHAARESI